MGRKSLNLTTEEKKQKNRDASEKYRVGHKEKVAKNVKARYQKITEEGGPALEKRNARRKKYYEKNKSTILARQKKWVQDHPEKHLQYQQRSNEKHFEKRQEWRQEYYEKNKVELLAKQKEYRETHKEEKREYIKAWRAAHPDYNKNRSSRKALEKLIAQFQSEEAEA